MDEHTYREAVWHFSLVTVIIPDIEHLGLECPVFLLLNSFKFFVPRLDGFSMLSAGPLGARDR